LLARECWCVVWLDERVGVVEVVKVFVVVDGVDGVTASFVDAATGEAVEVDGGEVVVVDASIISLNAAKKAF